LTQNLTDQGQLPIDYKYNYNQLVGISYPDHYENNVYYQYGDPNDPAQVAANAVGRIYFQEDASGFQKFKYGRMGEVTENIRTFVLPNEPNHYTFKMNFEYDSWNRIQMMVYPDEEKVFYQYNLGGDLMQVEGIKSNESFNYIDNITYDKFGHKTGVDYGNGTTVGYTYDNLQRLSNLVSYTSGGEKMQDIKYDYDAVSNIEKTGNYAGVLSNGLGATYFYHHRYDDLYRLIQSDGDGGYLYNLDMSYSPSGRIEQKHQNALYDIGYLYTDACDYAYNYISGTHQIKSISDPSGNHAFEWDGNGNMIFHQDKNKFGYRYLCWDEENRLMAMYDNTSFGYYMYDASGERTYKMNGEMEANNNN
jgi:YD repeat-containing protein